MKWYRAILLFSFTAAGLGQTLRPEPIDVPPITEEYGNPGYQWCDMGACTWFDADPKRPDAFLTAPKRRTHLTCADKTRFLMTAEDGSKHCIALRNPMLAAAHVPPRPALEGCGRQREVTRYGNTYTEFVFEASCKIPSGKEIETLCPAQSDYCFGPAKNGERGWGYLSPMRSYSH